jgi:5-methyltetrahydropteroyltriglutamate--homocysteine methyltransferase
MAQPLDPAAPAPRGAGHGRAGPRRRPGAQRRPTQPGDRQARSSATDVNRRRSIDANNELIAGFPDDVVFGVHLCRGNRESQWHREGTYDAIAESVLGSLHYDRLMLEYDTDRAGGFEPLRFVRDDAIVVLGLLTTKTGDMEAADEIKRRIEEASQFVPVERLALSTQCGFASGIDVWRE